MRKTFGTLIAVLLIAAVMWWWRSAPAPDIANGCFGTPQATVDDIRHRVSLLRNAGFDVGYSELLGNPLWVSYTLDTPRYPPPESRPRFFESDPRSLRGIRHDAMGAGKLQQKACESSLQLKVVPKGPQTFLADFTESELGDNDHPTTSITDAGR